MNACLTMREKVKQYLDYRRHAGYELRIEGEQLLHFARFAEELGHCGPLTLALASRWACASVRPGAITAARRIEVLRGFARYCESIEPGTEVPPRSLFGRAHRRLTPHIYTEEEIDVLLEATAILHPAGGLRSASCRAIFGLIAATGLRISEAVGLDRDDVDLDKRVILIRHGKFGKSRWVPIHSTTAVALRQYVAGRDREPETAAINAFFVGDYGRPMTISSVEYAFRRLRQKLGWTARGGHPAPRIHDLRHTFVCRTLRRWYECGNDIDHDILALSTYLGHAKVTDTYWYVTATPELLALAAQRFEQTEEMSHEQ